MSTIEWRDGSPGFRRARVTYPKTTKERIRTDFVLVVSNGTAALSMEIVAQEKPRDRGAKINIEIDPRAMTLHVPFPISEDAIRGQYDPMPCEFIDGKCYPGATWYGLAREMYEQHGECEALWVAMEQFLTDRQAEYTAEWAHKKQCPACYGKGIFEELNHD